MVQLPNTHHMMPALAKQQMVAAAVSHAICEAYKLSQQHVTEELPGVAEELPLHVSRSWASWLVFYWVNPLMARGCKRQLQAADLFCLPKKLLPSTCSNLLWQIWAMVGFPALSCKFVLAGCLQGCVPGTGMRETAAATRIETAMSWPSCPNWLALL